MLITNTLITNSWLLSSDIYSPCEGKIMEILLDITKSGYNELFFAGPGSSLSPCFTAQSKVLVNNQSEFKGPSL